MSTVEAERAAPWRNRPGWGINVDLTPPEVLEERAVARLRGVLGTGLLAVLVVVGLVFVLAARHHGAAEDALDQETAVQTQLRSQARTYSSVSQMQTALDRLDGQLATVLGSDVRFDLLGADLAAGLPQGMRLDSQTVTINVAGATAATGSTDSTGATEIGTVTLSGNGRSLDDVATYVARLQAVTGVADVVPTSNATTDDGVDFTVTMNLTDTLLTHRFDPDTTGSTTGTTTGSAQ